MMSRIASLAAFASWTTLVFWAGWEIRKRWATFYITRFIRTRTKQVAEAYAAAEERKQAAIARNGRFQA